MDYFTSDWHLGHYNTIRYSMRPFKDVEEMDNTIIDNLLSKVKKGDNLYFLGDIAMDADHATPFIEKILKRKINFFWVVGNHDVKIIKKLQEQDTKIRFFDTLTIKRYHKIIHLNHFPLMLWEKSFRNSFHLYGHVHCLSPELEEVEKRQTGKALNVNVEFNDFKPFSLYDVFDIMETKEDNWDYLLLQKRDEEAGIV